MPSGWFEKSDSHPAAASPAVRRNRRQVQDWLLGLFFAIRRV